MDIYEVVGYRTGLSKAGVNFLEPKDSFAKIRNGLIHRQVLKSRMGFARFAPRLEGDTRVLGIFEDVLPDGSKELLAIDKLYLYKYVQGTNTFTKINFTSADPIVNFGIAGNDNYVSGTSYFTSGGLRRFVFTGSGMSDIYFYDGVGVKRFTNAVDNADYAAPPEGALTRAKHVIWYGERLNFICPTIAAKKYSQGVLYSGIRDASGKGDKFNIAGSGLMQADTFEEIMGLATLGDYLILSLQRSTWFIQKTRDVFNPYVIKKIPSVLGVDADFSSVAWGYEVKSMGKTGLLSCDGRQSLRFDDKIPDFTKDDVDQKYFSLSYGGFERATSQFMWAYRGEESGLADLTQDKVLVHNYEEGTWAINDERFSVFGQGDKGQDLVWNDIDYGVDHESWGRMDTTEEIWDRIGIGEHEQKTLAGDNEGFIYELERDFDDYFVSITNITQAAQAVLTVSDSAFKIGDEVYINEVEGMTEINGIYATVMAATATSVTVNVDSQGFTAYTTGGNISKVIDFYVELNPFNPYREVGRKCYISHIDFLVDKDSGAIDVKLLDNQDDIAFKTAQVIPDPDDIFPLQWITVTVDHESDFITLALGRKSVTTQTKIYSIRIHCKAGAD